MRLGLILLFLLLSHVPCAAQKGFQFVTHKSKVVIPFQLINNLIFIPVNVNGVELNFLLDTGVEETILLSLEDKAEVRFFDVQKIMLRGLGSAEPIEGMKSANNELSVNGIVDKSHDLYIVLDQSFNFSSHIGIPVNGIIGYHFFKDNLVEVDYDKRRLVVFRDTQKRRKKIKDKYIPVPITVEKSKPYVVADVTVDGRTEPAKLLLDLGNSDALWLFKGSRFEIPAQHFEDYLGKGFSGDIHGNRARITDMKIDRFAFDRPIVAFPDSASVKSVNMVKDRVGSIGGEVLRRFDLVMDYAHKTLYLRRGRAFDEPFHYNMSGIEMQHQGTQWVQETVAMQTVYLENTFDESGTKKDNFKYKFSLKPVYSISSVRKDSPADLCGLQKDDVVVSINNSQAYKLTLQKINELLKSEDGKWIYIEVDRGGQILKFRFQLKAML
ncbi:retropepsin-like aspartic protease [Flavobacterium caeni]|uniref:PDZ domain-containing protein n=1 Tax=Flavobacterium caeni TaxID=490189 RepID=A0A1G5CLV7_9FLAO|nr:aspartyl protease family protein [Flavobacterium caeni]SCY03392.1 PDZ domain-containing protein [Flavobacterium caeni]